MNRVCLLGRIAGVLLVVPALGCGPRAVGAPAAGVPTACEGNRLLRVSNDTERTIEVTIREGNSYSRRPLGVVQGRGERTFQVPSRGVIGVGLVPFERGLTRYEIYCG